MNPLNHFGIKNQFIRKDTSSYNRFSDADIKLVEDADLNAQSSGLREPNRTFQNIFSRAEANNTSGYGWRGIAEKDPEVFETALAYAKKMRR